jgi:trehalose 6-phosphate synthase
MGVTGLWKESGERQRLILASNRGPLEYAYDSGGMPEARQGTGGVVSGLLCAVRDRPITWIALAMNEADRAVARTGMQQAIPSTGDVDLADIEVRLVDISSDAYRRHYLGISNRILWFVQHYLLAPATARTFTRRVDADWRKGYVVANRAIADAVISTLRTHGMATPVLFQDYHLYLAPHMVRAALPGARLAHFVHIPWPDARYWEMLPGYIVRGIYEGLAANDLIGFQTVRDAHNFMLGAERYLNDARLEWHAHAESGALVWPRRRSLVRAFPIAVTRAEVERCADSPDARCEATAVQRQITRGDLDHRLIVRVDRLEPTKNIVRGFQAYERLLKYHPEWRGRVTFLAQLVPSRQELTAYRHYERQVSRIVEQINARYGRPEWQPVVCIYEHNRPCALALMRHYHVLLVNPVIDGMNLVVKEGGLLNRQDGVIVLSRTAGAYEQLGPYVLGVHPMDVEQTAESLRQALEMPVESRQLRALALRSILRKESAEDWLAAQLTWLLGPDVVPTDTVALPATRPAQRTLPGRQAVAQPRMAPTRPVSLPDMPALRHGNGGRTPVWASELREALAWAEEGIAPLPQ